VKLAIEYRPMGYRVLLKRYMQQLRKVAENDFVEDMVESGELSKREYGELRAISAELNREAGGVQNPAPDNKMTDSSGTPRSTTMEN